MASEEQIDFVNKVDESAWNFADIIIAKVKNFTSIGGGSILSKTLDDAKVLVFSDSHGNVDRRSVLRSLEQVKQIVLSALIDRSKPYATLREGDVSNHIKRGLEEFLAAESSGNGGVNTFSVNDGDLRFYLSENIDRITDPTTPVGWRGAMFAAVMFDKILADEGMLQNTIAVDARKINLVQFENKYSTIRTRLSSYLQGVDEDESGMDINEYMPAIINLDISRFKTAYGKPLKIANLANAFNKVNRSLL